MRVTLLGSGTSLPDPDRVQSGILVEAGNQTILFDIGSGTLHRLTQTQVDVTSIDAVFITHFHIDHCSDFVPLCQTLWLSGYQKTLKLFGPSAMREWARGVLEVAFPYLRGKIRIELMELEERETVYLGPVAISTSITIHGSMDTRAYKIEHEGKSVVYTGDTGPCRDVIELAKGADLLIHELNWMDGKHPEGVHTSPSELMSIVEETYPHKVVLTHLSPDVITNRKSILATIGRRSNAEVIIGEDLMVLDV
ncbi:MAG: MBL fold metallo-hydrolase [Candidatus Thorarchaeota archaeon]